MLPFNNSQNKLYGTSILPAFIIFAITPYALLQILIDSVFDWGIIFAVSFIIYQRINAEFIKTNALRIFLSGFIAKYVGVAYLALLGIPTDVIVFTNKIKHGYMFSIFKAMEGYTYYDKTSFLFILSGIIVAFISIFLAQFLIGFKKIFLKTWQKIIFALILAVLTTPYLFFIPSELIP